MVRCAEGHAVVAGSMKRFGEVLAEAYIKRGLTLKAVAARVVMDDEGAGTAAWRLYS
jgi:hypothetical protein